MGKRGGREGEDRAGRMGSITQEHLGQSGVPSRALHPSTHPPHPQIIYLRDKLKTKVVKWGALLL